MQCPKCKLENAPSAPRCVRCGLALNESDLTVLSDHDAEHTLAGKDSSNGESPTGPESPGTSEDWAASKNVSGGITLTPQGTLEPGTVLGQRYEILKLLGEGGMGAVYKARDRELDRLVALKVIRSELAGQPSVLQRFKQELILARSITHRNIIRIFDLGVANGLRFITMEFVEGQDLNSLLEEKKFPPAEAVAIIQQVCAALEAAQAENVV